MHHLKERWFLICLTLAVSGGYTFSDPLKALAELGAIRNVVLACVLFVMSLPLEFQKIVSSIRQPWPVLLATSITYGLLPLFAWCLVPLLQGELGIGLLMVAATPCSLASAAVWTRRAGGNDVAAMLISVVTNLSCFFVTPVWLKWTTGRAVLMDGLMIDMMSKLGLLVVLPMILAQLIRLLPPSLAGVHSRKKPWEYSLNSVVC